MSERSETTALLVAWTGGSAAAGEDLFARLYDQLRAVAGRLRRSEPAASTLQTTALVHELYLRLVDQRAVDWQGRGQFFAIAARVMRRILVDHARARLSNKRGGAAHIVSLEALGEVSFGERPEVLLAIDTCLQDLERLDPAMARLVDLRFFAGLSIEDAAEALGQSRATTVRQWRMTKGWLHRQLAVSAEAEPVAEEGSGQATG